MFTKALFSGVKKHGSFEERLFPTLFIMDKIFLKQIAAITNIMRDSKTIRKIQLLTKQWKSMKRSHQIVKDKPRTIINGNIHTMF